MAVAATIEADAEAIEGADVDVDIVIVELCEVETPASTVCVTVCIVEWVGWSLLVGRLCEAVQQLAGLASSRYWRSCR